jgi:hypothetical protein
VRSRVEQHVRARRERRARRPHVVDQEHSPS